MATIMSWRCSLCKFYKKACDKASLQILALRRVNAHARMHCTQSLRCTQNFTHASRAKVVL